ncbi:DNA-directed RNA polymerase I subunit RPA43, partial [Gryllus bimaculatus]
MRQSEIQHSVLPAFVKFPSAPWLHSAGIAFVLAFSNTSEMVTSRFNATDLSKLLKKPNACVFLRKSKRHIALTPKALNNTNDSVLVHLNRLVRKFDPELDAVVLGCRNVSILTNLGTIVDDSPHVHLDIEAEFYLFKPEKDSLLSGVVNKKSRDNIGCLVHDIFNVSIPIEPDEGIDIDNISIGQTLTFCVVVVDFSHPIPFIKGKLIDSRAQSPGKQASDGKKRKRSDQLEVCKKMKLEIDSPLCAEDNVNTFTPPIKFPTSILKKTTPFGVESSPARRISFFGDVPEAPNETNTTEGKAKKKKKNEASFLEESPSRRKKKPSVSSLGNEPETEVEIQDSRQIDSDSTGNQKVKKKHSEQTDQVHDFADEPEQDFNILQDFKVHSKKTKNKAAFENSSKLMEADEISKEINDLSASHLKTKKKRKKHEILEEVPGTCNASNIHEKIKKQGSRNENETWITKQNHHDQEQSNETPNRKKSKKSNKMALNEQENTSYITGKGEHSEEKAQGSPQKRKKRISEEKGELKIREFNVAEIINKTVEDAMKSKKRKEKGISEVDVQQNESSVSSPKKQNPNFTNEIKQRKKALRKGKKDPLQTLTSFSEHCATEEQHPQQSILQAVQLTPVVKKKKNEKISPEHGEVSDSRVHEYFGKKDKSFSENSKIKRIINSTTIDSSNRLQENHYSGAGDNGFESLSPIKKSNDDNDDDDDDNDNEEEEEEPSGFITSTQIEGSKTKKMVSNAVSFGNDLNEVSVRNSFSDSDSFDVEEFSLSYVPQNVKQKKESKDHIASPISSQERKSQISGNGIDATNSTNVTTKRGKHSDIDNISNNMLVPRLSPFTSKQNMTVQSMNQKRHSKSSGADSSISDSESHSREHNKELRISTIKSTEICSPKSVISKGVQTDEESDGVKSNEHAAGKEKKMYFSDKQMKVQSRTLTNTKHKRSESNDADSTDSDLPTFLKKPTKLSSVTTQSGNVPHEPKVSSSNTHKKGTRKSKITDGGPHLNPQKQDPMSPVKKNIFDKPKSKGMDKKHDPVSSSVDSNLHLSKKAKPAKQKQFPNSYQEHGSDSSSSDSDVPSPKHLPPSKAAKTKTQKEVHVSYQEQDSSSSDADLPLSMDVPPSKAAKTTTQKQVPVSHKKQA